MDIVNSGMRVLRNFRASTPNAFEEAVCKKIDRLREGAA
jgi:hypothetical protein